MSRDPAIHLKSSDLLKIFKTLNVDVDIDKFLKESLKYAIRNRSIIKTTRQTKKKLDKLRDFDTKKLNQFQNKLITIRQQHNFRGVQVIRENDSAYTLLKEIVTNAVDFCKAYDLGLDRGFSIYISRCLAKMGKRYGLNRFKTYHNIVFEEYECDLIIEADKKKEQTEMFYNLYLDVLESEGVIDHELQTVEYVHIVTAREIADELEADYEDYIKAQFENWISGEVPPPAAFVTARAKSSYKLYMKASRKQHIVEKAKYDSI